MRIVVMALALAGGLLISGQATAKCSIAHPCVAQPIQAVFQAPDLDRQTITKRGATCIGKHVRSGLTTADVIITNDPESGIVVARNVLMFDSIAMGLTGRSVITLEAKDGRFRITHDDIQYRINTSWLNAPPPASFRSALESISRAVANCVTAGPVGDF